LPLPALPHDVLVRIFSFVPSGELRVTPGRVCRAWAAAQVEAWRLPNLLVRGRMYELWCPVVLPGWYARSKFPLVSSTGRERMICAAAFHGQLDFLAEFYEMDPSCFTALSLGRRACQAAAGQGQLATLRWLRERGVAWDEETCYEASKADRLDVLKECVERGAPINVTRCIQVSERCSCQKCREWLRATFPAYGA
jgi:hypothetical protein